MPCSLPWILKTSGLVSRDLPCIHFGGLPPYGTVAPRHCERSKLIFPYSVSSG